DGRSRSPAGAPHPTSPLLRCACVLRYDDGLRESSRTTWCAVIVTANKDEGHQPAVVVGADSQAVSVSVHRRTTAPNCVQSMTRFGAGQALRRVTSLRPKDSSPTSIPASSQPCGPLRRYASAD